MAEVVLFHHVQGLTDGVRAFADQLRAGGHTVHTPDLFDGERPATHRGGRRATRRRSATRCSTGGPSGPWPTCPTDLVYAGFSWGAGRPSGWPRPGRAPAARCSTRPACRSPASGRSGRGRRGAGAGPRHGRRIRSSALEGDIDAARELVATVGPELGELFVYPGDRHLFTDSSLPSYDADAAALVVQRSRQFLDRVG